jgi:predicted dehydrogenase
MNSESQEPAERGINRRDFLRQSSCAAAVSAVASGAILQAATPASGPVVMAFVGCAHIHTPGFIDLLKKRPDVKVKSVWDHDSARANRRASQLGSRAVADVNTIWQDPEIGAVVICSETNRHPGLVLSAAQARKPMFVEKPLGITARESREMADAIVQSGVHFTTGYFMRTSPQHLFLREQVERGTFGKITRIRGSNCHSGSLGGWFDTEWRWMADPKIAGVGGFGDLGTHSLDLMMWLLGEVAEATADINVVTGRYGSCDESGEGLLKFKNGAVGTLAAGWVDVDNPVTLLISGTEGHAVLLGNDLHFRSQKVEGADGRDPWTKLPKPLPAPLDQFVDAVLGKSAAGLVSPREAAARVSVMEAMYEGARQRSWVKPL